MVSPSWTQTRPENLSSSSKRTSSKPSIYSHLLPLVPAQPSLFSPFLSPLAPPTIQAVYDPITTTISVEGEDDMRLLWRSGFFGKGTLSRSEPSWMRRVENRRAELLGGEKRYTAEELTAQRRVERKSTKLVKKAEREAEKLLAASASVAGSSLPSPAAPSTSSSTLPPPLPLPELDPLEPIPEGEADEEKEGVEPPPEWHLQAERTQLLPEETFFLLFGLRCLSLTSFSPWSTDSTPTSLSPLQTWQTFLKSAVSLPKEIEVGGRDARLERWDSPFLVSYAVYHHYRSMGWVVRPGSKFCVDWVLYGPGGPVGGHAEFAVLVIPSYADSEDEKTNPFSLERKGAEGFDRKSWKWFTTVNRVCSGVKKTLVLLHVLIPPLSSLPKQPNWVAEHPAQALAKFEMREVVVRRWIAGRQRD